MLAEPDVQKELAARLKDHARALGFDLVGVVDPARSAHLPHFHRWLAAGLHGDMAYLARADAVRRRGDLSLSLESVRSAVVVGQNYYVHAGDGEPADASRGIIARYARGRDYHKVIEGRLRELHRWIESEAGSPVGGRVYVDTGPILERELGQRAGFGWFGKNTMLIAPRQGSYFFRGILLLDLALPVDEAFAEERCGTCRRCLDACPTGALKGYDANGAPVMDARLCISYLTIEHRGPIPRDLRRPIGNRIFGCDICQEVCPFNLKFAELTSEAGYAARGPGERPVGVQAEAGSEEGRHPGTHAPSLIELMRMTPDHWDSFSRGSAIRRAGYAGFKRNVAVAIGNWLRQVDEPQPEAIAALIDALADPQPLVRGHAAWALSETSAREAPQALAARLETEVDPFVREELVDALRP